MKDQDIRVTYAWRDMRDGRERTIATVLSDAMFVGVDQAQRTKVNRTVQVIGQVHGVRNGSDCVERDGTGAELPATAVGENVPCATRMHVSESCEGRETGGKKRAG